MGKGYRSQVEVNGYVLVKDQRSGSIDKSHRLETGTRGQIGVKGSGLRVRAWGRTLE